ncbi:MAG TPA: tRNA (N6-threonylcarbamoyladenosine(37)-N6)-methyltransferase TrmO [Luteitalea sp.]|nr:tRNA (N6-threonylcarbamoyladenosine(37)-N6)-methyltransferase TrmO [Luteitalea sp.]
MSTITLEPVGVVRSLLTSRTNAPRQPDEGAPPARIDIGASYREALEGLQTGDRIVVLTWLHAGDRTVRRVHPRGDRTRPALGVFATRSPDRPNPVGLHEVTVTAVTADSLEVDGLEAIDGTPVLDVKPVLASDVGAR